MSEERSLSTTSTSKHSKEKKKCSAKAQYPANAAGRTASVKYSENVNSDEDRRKFLDTVAVVQKLPRIPNVGKYLRRSKASRNSKTNSGDGDIIQNYL